MIPVRLRRFIPFLSLLLVPCLLLSGCNIRSEITAVPSGSLVVDVRTVEEFEDDHYPGALNVPVDELQGRLDLFGAKDQSIVVYCRSGFRSSRAKRLLQENGYTAVKNGGGLSDMMSLAPQDEQNEE